MHDFEISFHPIGKRLRISKPTTILQAAEILGLNLGGPCGGKGKCGKCKIKIIKFPRNIYIPPDTVSKELLSDSDLKKGLRLACTVLADSDISVEVPTWAIERPNEIFETSTIQVKGWVDPDIDYRFRFDPVIKDLQCFLPKPNLDDNISDLERLRKFISKELNTPPHEVELNHSMMCELTTKLHENDWQVEAILAFTPNRTELIGLRSSNNEKKVEKLGIALDIGTSTLVAYLIDLYTGSELRTVSAVNPQIRIGADVISRIRYTIQTLNGDEHLSNMLKNTINQMLQKLYKQTKFNAQNIFEVVAVGNTTMLHNFLGLPIASLGIAPYIPVYNGHSYTAASKLGLDINLNGKVYVGPMIAGFLGTDAVGTALITNMNLNNGNGNDKSEIKLAIDIGTNGEILLCDNERILACSAAAGPAFEGSNLRFGVRALPGAVNEVYIRNKKIRYSTIDKSQAIGITGSGTVDAISEFIRVGAIKHNGNIDQQIAKHWLRYQKNIKLKHSMEPSPTCDLILPELRIVPKWRSVLDTSITITQADIREIQLAKAALKTGIEILMDELGVSNNDLDVVYLAGAFGNYIKPKSAVGINLLPDIDLRKIKPIGNAAGASAKVLLRSKSAREQVKKIADSIQSIDLATHNKFQDLFIKNMEF